MSNQTVLNQFITDVTNVRRSLKYLTRFNEKTSCLRNLIPELRRDTTANRLTSRDFARMRNDLERHSPKSSKKYQTALNTLSSNWTWAVPIAPIMIGRPHPTRTKTRMDESISDSGRSYRVYRQSKSDSCGPTCCLIVLMNYYKNKEYTEKMMRDELMTVQNGYVPYNGTNMIPLRNTLYHKLSTRSSFYEGCDFHNLRTCTTKQGKQLYPAILRIQWNNGGGHFIVVAETIGDIYFVIDPLKGHIRELRRSHLENYDNAGQWDGRIVCSYE
jgi:predicted double-glycine peptidase